MRDYSIRFVDVPDSDQLILKLIFSASKNITGRKFIYLHEQESANQYPQIFIVDQTGQQSGSPMNSNMAVCIGRAETDSLNNKIAELPRPLLATRVLSVLDDVVAELAPQEKEKEIIVESLEDDSSEEAEDIVDFCISEEEASDLAIVHDDSLSNPANYRALDTEIDQGQRKKIVNIYSNQDSQKNDALENVAVSEKSGIKVLVVDDSPSVRKQIELELELYDVAVSFAETAAEANDFIDSEDFKLILLDVMLPDGDGFTICKNAKLKKPQTTIIMLTGKSTQADKIKGTMAGCDDYLVKPVGRSIFQDAVEQYIPMCSEFSTSINNESSGELYVNK